MFREWDEDADGLVDKKEFRKVIAALGYDAPSADINAVFAAPTDGSGKIEQWRAQEGAQCGQRRWARGAQRPDKLPAAIRPAGNATIASNASKPPEGSPAQGSGGGADGGGSGGWDRAEADDVANEQEEDFEIGMRRRAIDYTTHDINQDNKLDFDEFCAMVRQREEGDHTEDELRRFESSMPTAVA